MFEHYDYGKELSKNEYYDIQIKRSNSKFSFCRVSILDAIFMLNIVKKYGYEFGPIICMGTRSGREVDLFRIAVKSGILAKLTYLFEIRRHVFSSVFPFIESIGRSDKNIIKEDTVMGVEINPRAERKDVLVASFDELPKDYENKFTMLYSNSFDQSLSPEKTARQWLKVLKHRGFLVLHYKENERPSYTDPTGGLNVESLKALFPGDVLHSAKSNIDKYNPSCLIIRIDKGSQV